MSVPPIDKSIYGRSSRPRGHPKRQRLCWPVSPPVTTLKPPPAFPRQGRTEKNRRNKKSNWRLFFYSRAQPSPLIGPPSICSPGSQEALFFLAPAASQARGCRQTPRSAAGGIQTNLSLLSFYTTIFAGAKKPTTRATSAPASNQSDLCPVIRVGVHHQSPEKADHWV